MDLKRNQTMQWWRERLIGFALLLCALVSIATTAGIIVVLFSEAVYSFSNEKAFFQEIPVTSYLFGTVWSPEFSEKHFGVLPLICGTFLIAGIAGLVGLPLGMLSAIFLSEYAAPRTRRIIKPMLEILAGIPTVVYGYFAFAFLTPYLIKPVFSGMLGMDVDAFNALSAGLVVAFMIIPMVCSLSEDALRAVPRSLREAGYALGSTKYDVCTKVVVPAATSGIVASFLLAISRAIGETMAVVIAAGNSPVLTLNPLRSIQTMSAFMVNISLGDTPAGSIEYKSLYAVGLTLFCFTLVMNIIAQRVMHRFREVYH